MITAARQIAEAFKQTYESNALIEDVVILLDNLVKDEEQSVRMVVMEQIPEIAIFCHEVGEPLQYIIPQHILPHIITLLGDKFIQVRKVAQMGVLNLVERGVISPRTVEESFFPVILKSSDLHSLEDHRPEIEVITFMCKVAPIVGKDAIITSYLSTFCFHCEDNGFQVRRVCAMGMAEIAPVVGTLLTEKALLPRFLTLCEDEIWGVRKSCAESFTAVARVCSFEVRKRLALVYTHLLEDQSKWVRITAFETLGKLITTFYRGETEGSSSEVVPTEAEQRFLTEMRKCSKIVMNKKNQEIAQGNCRQKDDSNLVQKEELIGGGLDSPREDSGFRSSVDDEDDDDDGDWEWGVNPEAKECKPRSWILDRSFGRDMCCEVLMDCTEDETNEWKDAVGVIPEEMHADEGVETIKLEKQEDKTFFESSEPQSRYESSCQDYLQDPGFLCYQPLPKLSIMPSTNEESLHVHLEKANETNAYNTFQYWRLPIPDIETDIEMSNGKTNLHVRAKLQDPSSRITYASELNVNLNLEERAMTNLNAGNGEWIWNAPERNSQECDAWLLKNAIARGNHQYKLMREISFTEEIPSSQMDASSMSAPLFFQNEKVDETNSTKDVERETEANSGDVMMVEAKASSSITNPGSENISTVVIESSQTRGTLADREGFTQEVHRSYYNLFSVSNADSDKEGTSEVEMKYQIRKKIQLLEESFSNPTLETNKTEFQANRLYSSGGLYRTDNLPYIVKAHGPSGDRGRLLPILPTSACVEDQEIIPPALLKHYLSMADVEGGQSPIENEMPLYCAYSFPAVVITLGSTNWGILRECFEKLATMFQWKIRYTLGSCLHEIAKVVGPELAERDLFPFFNAIIKDIDEVRVGILSHLAKFTSILNQEARIGVLGNLITFLRTDNKNNWRFRHELASQLEDLTEMFDPEAVFHHLCPVGMQLVVDPIADVRKAALVVLSRQVKRLNSVNWEEEETNLLQELILELVKLLCRSRKWVQRQSFASLAGHLVSSNAIEPTEFAQNILPHLISLSDDKVPNVRFMVAQVLSSLINLDWFPDPSNPHNSILVDTIKTLQKDTDEDVRFYSRLGPNTIHQSESLL